jgi:hypothetical protein
MKSDCSQWLITLTVLTLSSFDCIVNFTFDGDDSHALGRADAVGGQDGVGAGVASFDLLE